MAESIVQVTEGSGKKLHTWNRTIGANSIEDEYVQLGEPGLPTYIIATGSTSAATADSDLLQIMAGGTNRVRVRRIEIYQSALATTAATIQFTIFRLTTAGTGGTVQGVNPLDSADGAAGLTAMTLPTAKGTRGAAIWGGNAYLMQTAGASTPQVQPIACIDFDRLRSKPLIIPSGTANGICLITINAHAAATLRMSVWVDETSFV